MANHNYKAYYELNKERLNKESREYQRNHNSPEDKKKKAAAQRAYRSRHVEKAREYSRLYAEQHKGEFNLSRLVSHAKSRAKKYDVPFSITTKYIKSIWPEDNCCPILRTPFVVNKHHDSKCTSATLDKIVPSLGYVEGNVIVISGKANRIKNNATLQELMAVSNYYQSIIN